MDQLTELQEALGGPAAEGTNGLRIADHIPERNTELVGRIREPFNRGLTDSALWRVENAQKADGISRVHQQLEIGKNVLDLAPVVEAKTSDNNVGDAPSHQRFFHGTTLRIGSIENRHIAPTQIWMSCIQHAHAMHDCFSLGNLVIATGQADQLTLPTCWAQDLVNTLGVMSDQGIGGLKNSSRRAIILLKLDHRASGIVRRSITKVILEAHQNSKICRPEAVNTLIGITDNKNRALLPVVEQFRITTISYQQLDKFVLRTVGILIFVNQNMPEAAMPIMANLIVLAQKLDGKQQKIVKVESIIGCERTPIAAIRLSHQLSTLTTHISLKLIRHPALILRITDRPANLLRLKSLGIKAKVLSYDFFDQILGIALVINGELTRPAQTFWI